MAEYDIIGGIVSAEALEGLKLFKKEVSEIVAIMQKGNLTSLASAKEIAQVDKLRASTEILIEKQKKAAADAAAAALRRDQIIERQIALEEKKSQKEKQNADTWLNFQKQKYEADFKKLQLEEKQFAAMLKQEQKENEKAANDARRAAEKAARDNANLTKQEQREAIAFAKAEERRAIREAKEIATAQKIANAQATKAFAGSQGGVTQKTDLQAQATVMKLNATIASQYTSELQKMDAQMKLISLDLQKMVVAKQTESKAYTDGIAKLKNMSLEYDRLSKASGASMMKTKSMYGSTFQLTQVMRELPNFAIDARVGFMALSNNLPMLADGFSQLKNEIDATTGKAYGFGGAAKIFAKSLLSLNTIMIVASTLLVLYGKDIVELFTGKVPLAERAMESYIKTIKEGNGEFTQATEKFFKLSAIMTSASKGFISQKDAVEEYNKEFGKTNGYVTTFEEAQKRMVMQAPNYIKAMGMMAYANTFLAEAVKLYGDAEALRADKTVSAWAKIGNWLKGGYYGYKSMEDAVLAGRENEAKKIDNQINSAIESYQNAYNKFAEFAQKSGIDIWGDESKPKEPKKEKPKKEKPKKERDMQQGTDFNLAQETFNEERIRLLEVISIAEERMQKNKETGERNYFATRLKNAESFRNAKNSIAELEYNDEKENLLNTNSLQNDEAAKTMANNDRLFAEGKMTKKRHKELEDSYTKYVLTAESNFQTKMLKLDYDYKKTSEKNELEYSKNKTKIVVDTIRMIEQEEIESSRRRNEILQGAFDITLEFLSSYFEIMNEKLKEQSDIDSKRENEKAKDIEDREKAGVLTKVEAEEEKARLTAYYASVEEAAAKKQEELKKQQFLISQALAAAEIWIKYALTVANYTAAESAMTLATLGLGAPAAAAIYEPLKAQALLQAGISSGLILAQSIPYFAEGGIMDKGGKAILGDGGKRELAISPSGNFFISKDTPTMYNLEKGTQILPDVNKVDLMGILALKQVMPQQGDDRMLVSEMRNITKAIQAQKQGNFYGMPLIKQLDSRGRYSSRNRSLMN